LYSYLELPVSQFYDQLIIDQSIDLWYPINPIVDTAKLFFSMYINDSTLTSIYDFPCDSVNLLYDEFVSIIENSDNAKIILYPNPTNESFSIKHNEIKHYSKIEIYDVKGTKVKTVYNTLNNEKISLTEFDNGIYFIKVILESDIQTFKILKL
jgi:hypothetical protein